MKKINQIASLFVIMGLSFLVGCSTPARTVLETESSKMMSEEILAQQEALEVKRAELEQRATELERTEAELSEWKNAPQPPTMSDLLPPDAKPGECYARVWVEPVFKELAQEVLVKEESEIVHTLPAQFTTATKEVLIKEPDYEIRTIPATYKKVSTQKLLSEAELVWRTDLAQSSAPASNELLIAAENGGIDIDGATPGMCFHEHYIPAEYEYEEEAVLVKEGHDVVSVAEPEYQWVEKEVIVKEESTRLESIPAVYETVTVEKLVADAQEVREVIPAEYEEVVSREMEKEGFMEWRSILCKTNMTTDVIGKIQRELVELGYDTGRVDGVIGKQTMSAINDFQRDNDLPVDEYLNMKTVEALGIEL